MITNNNITLENIGHIEEKHNETHVKKLEKEDPNIYSGINLLNTAFKLTTKVLPNRINKVTTLSHKQ